MIFETSMQARFLVPMAISLGFGVMFTTFVILVLVPVLYAILQKITGNTDDVVGPKQNDLEPIISRGENTNQESDRGADLAAASEALELT